MELADFNRLTAAVLALREFKALSVSLMGRQPEVHLDQRQFISLAGLRGGPDNVRERDSGRYPWQAEIYDSGVTYYALFTDEELPLIGYRVEGRRRAVPLKEVSPDVQPDAS